MALMADSDRDKEQMHETAPSPFNCKLGQLRFHMTLALSEPLGCRQGTPASKPSGLRPELSAAERLTLLSAVLRSTEYWTSHFCKPEYRVVVHTTPYASPPFHLLIGTLARGSSRTGADANHKPRNPLPSPTNTRLVCPFLSASFNQVSSHETHETHETPSERQ